MEKSPRLTALAPLPSFYSPTEYRCQTCRPARAEMAPRAREAPRFPLSAARLFLKEPLVARPSAKRDREAKTESSDARMRFVPRPKVVSKRSPSFHSFPASPPPRKSQHCELRFLWYGSAVGANRPSRQRQKYQGAREGRSGPRLLGCLLVMQPCLFPVSRSSISSASSTWAVRIAPLSPHPECRPHGQGAAEKVPLLDMPIRRRGTSRPCRDAARRNIFRSSQERIRKPKPQMPSTWVKTKSSRVGKALVSGTKAQGTRQHGSPTHQQTHNSKAHRPGAAQNRDLPCCM